MNKQLTIFALVTCFALGWSAAVFATPIAFQVSDIGSSAEMIGRANIGGFSRSANGIFENPASLYRINAMSASLFTTTFMETITYFNAAYAAKTEYGGFGVGIYSASVPEIYETYQYGSATKPSYGVQSSFRYENYLVKAAYQSSPAPNIYVGTSALFYSSGFTIGNYKSKGANVEIGGIWDLKPLELSLVGTNLIGQWGTLFESGGSEILPTRFIFSGRYDFTDAELLTQITRTGHKPGFLRSFAVSAPLLSRLLHISAGYKEFYNLDDIQSNYTIGLGLSLNGMDFEYAYERSSNPFFNGKHYFSTNLYFGDAPIKKELPAPQIIDPTPNVVIQVIPTINVVAPTPNAEPMVPTLNFVIPPIEPTSNFVPTQDIVSMFAEPTPNIVAAPKKVINKPKPKPVKKIVKKRRGKRR